MIMQEHVHRFNQNYSVFQNKKEIEEVSKMNFQWKKLAEETIRRNKILNKNMKLKDKILKIFF
jgi:hypothetical protein